MEELARCSGSISKEPNSSWTDPIMEVCWSWQQLMPSSRGLKLLASSPGLLAGVSHARCQAENHLQHQLWPLALQGLALLAPTRWGGSFIEANGHCPLSTLPVCHHPPWWCCHPLHHLTGSFTPSQGGARWTLPSWAEHQPPEMSPESHRHTALARPQKRKICARHLHCSFLSFGCYRERRDGKHLIDPENQAVLP